MIALGVWQFTVSTTPLPGQPDTLEPRNLVYALQWWVFAGFGVWFWWRFIRDQRESEAELSDPTLVTARRSRPKDRLTSHQAPANTDSLGPAGPAAEGAARSSSERISLDGSAADRTQRLGQQPARPADPATHHSDSSGE